VTPSPLPSPNKTSLSLTDPVHLSKPTASLDTAVADSKGYFGRSVPYTDVHTAQMDTFYDLHISMKDSRLCVAAAVSRDTCFVACTQTFHSQAYYLLASTQTTTHSHALCTNSQPHNPHTHKRTAHPFTTHTDLWLCNHSYIFPRRS